MADKILYEHNGNLSVFSDFGMVKYWLQEFRDKLPKNTSKEVLDRLDFIIQTCHNTYHLNETR